MVKTLPTLASILSFWRIWILAYGQDSLVERVIGFPGRANDGSLLFLPSPTWFRKDIEEIQACLDFQIGAISGPYTVVGRGVSLDELRAIPIAEKLLLVNPMPETMKETSRLPHEVVVAGQDVKILRLARYHSCEIWTIRRADVRSQENTDLDDGVVISYSLTGCYDEPVAAHYEYEIDHFLGPVALLSIALRERDALTRVIGWDQYLSPSFSLESPFARFRGLVGSNAFFDRALLRLEVGAGKTFASEFGSSTSSVVFCGRALKRSVAGVLGWQPKFLRGVDSRHAIRNLVNIWIARLLLDEGVRVEGLIVPLAKSGKFWPRGDHL